MARLRRHPKTWTRALGGLALGLGLSAASGCGGADVRYELVFPSVETFLIAANATVTVYDGAEDPDRICRNLSVDQSPGISLIKTTGPRDVCSFEAEGGLTLSDIPVGRLVVFAEVNDRAGGALMRGCQVVDAYSPSVAGGLLGDEGPALVSIVLATLPTYPESPELSCVTIDEKCVEKKTCDSL